MECCGRDTHRVGLSYWSLHTDDDRSTKLDYSLLAVEQQNVHRQDPLRLPRMFANIDPIAKDEQIVCSEKAGCRGRSL